MKKCLCLLALLSMGLAVGSVFAGPPAQEVQAKLNAITSMSAHFSEVIKAGPREVSRTEGTMALLRPGRFRWETQKPLEQLVVADGKKLWIYDVDLEQVTVKKQGNTLGGTPALFLSSSNDMVSKDFNVIKMNPEKTGQVSSYELHAKSPKDNYQRVLLSFTADRLSSIDFFDQLGQHTTLQLSQVQNNPVLPLHLFLFKPPKGVDVVEQ